MWGSMVHARFWARQPHAVRMRSGMWVRLGWIGLPGQSGLINFFEAGGLRPAERVVTDDGKPRTDDGRLSGDVAPPDEGNSDSGAAGASGRISGLVCLSRQVHVTVAGAGGSGEDSGCGGAAGLHRGSDAAYCDDSTAGAEPGPTSAHGGKARVGQGRPEC